MAGPDESNINALLARGGGPAYLEGAHAGYYHSKMEQESEQERRRLAVQPDIPSALSGDTAAFGRVAANDPKAGLILSTEMQRLQQAQKQKHIEAIDWSGRAADTILQTNPSDRPAVWKQLYQQGASLGHDMSQTPTEWNPGLETQMRTIRSMATPTADRLRLELKKTPPGKAGGAGGGSDEVWGAPGKQSALPAPGPVVADAMPPGVQTAPYLPPATAAAAAPPGIATGQATATLASAAAPAAEPPAGPPQGFQPMGHRDPQGNLVPALMDGKPVFRNVQTGELTSNPQVAQGEPVPALSSGGTDAQGPGGGLPPGTQMAQKLGDRYSPKIVFDNPAERGGVYGTAPGEKGKRAIITGPGGGAIFKMPDGTFEEYKPDLKPAKAGKRVEDVLGPDGKTLIGQRNPDTNEYRPINQPAQGADNPQGLVGEDYIKTLPADRASLVKSLYEGRMALSPRLQSSPQGKQLMSDLMYAYPDDYDAIVNGQRAATAKAFATGQEAKNVTALNTAIQHLGEVHRLAQDLNNFSEGFGPLNTLVNKSKNYAAAQSGDRRVTDFDTAKHAVAEEVSRVFKGSSLSDAEIKAWEGNINSAMSPAQLQGQIDTITKLMEGRISALNEQYTKGMGKAAPNMQLITPQAQATLEHIHSAPLTQRTEGTAAPAAPPNAKAGKPPLDSFQR